MSDNVRQLVARASELRLAREPVDSAESVAVRHALTKLGQRSVVVPRAVAAAVRFVGDQEVFPANHSEDVLAALAGADQVILSMAVWRRVGPDALTREPHVSSGWQFDFGRSWAANVRDAYEAGQSEVANLPTKRRRLLVTIEWIDKTDVVGPDPHP